MSRSIATVTTENASRYLRQLCKHWSHRFAVEYDPEDLRQGFIDFGDGRRKVWLTAEGTLLTLTASDEQAEGLPELEVIVAKHIQRFAFKEELEFVWKPES